MPVNIFTPTIPLKPQSLGFTQPLVLGNFANYRENMEVNHEDVNSADFGKHKFLTLTNQASAPATGATEGGFYSTLISGRSVLFLQRENTSAEVGITMYPGTVAASTFAAFTNVIDLSALANATHPNYWAVMEIRDVTALGINGFLMLKVYKGSLQYVYNIVPLGIQTAGLGITASYQMAGNILQIKATPALGAPTALKFTITPFYFPE